LIFLHPKVFNKDMGRQEFKWKAHTAGKFVELRIVYFFHVDMAIKVIMHIDIKG